MRLFKHKLLISILVFSFCYGNINSGVNDHQKNYNIIKTNKSKKGGSVEPLKSPKYTWIKAYAVLVESVSIDKITENDIKKILKSIIEDLRKEYSPDAANVWLYTSDEKVGKSNPIGKIDWWPKNHSLSRDNEANINNKNEYVLNYSQINPPKEMEPSNKRLSNYSEKNRKKIFREIVKAEDKAEAKAESKYPINPDNIPDNKLNSYNWGRATRKHLELSEKLRNKYVKQILEKYNLTEQDKDKITQEARKENWALPERNK